jgi:hypothetical protein
MRFIVLRGGVVAAIAALAVLGFGIVPQASAQRVTAVAMTDSTELAAQGYLVIGNWSAEKQYEKGDLVTSRRSVWRAKRSNRNKFPGSTLPSTAEDWQLLVAGLNPLGAWLSSGTFHINDLVTYQGNTWRAKRTSMGQAPVAGADWEQFAARGMVGPPGPAGPIGPAGPNSIPRGSASAPAISFSNDPNTGIFSPGSGKIALVTDGALFLHSRGNETTALGVAALEKSGSLEDEGVASVGNTAVGFFALRQTTNGFSNTAVGEFALQRNTIGGNNTALGAFSNENNTTGNGNTAVGNGALHENVTGNFNIALGHGSLRGNSSGSNNIGIGLTSLQVATASSNNIAIGTETLKLNVGDTNIAIGRAAGSVPTNSTRSIFIGNEGLAADTATIKIGTQGAQTKAFMAGISGVTTAVNDAVPVMIDSTGQFGVTSSSRRYKDDIAAMPDMTEMLQQLRPVTFRYKKPYSDGSKPIQYGLIAEEVADVFPDLAVFNAEGTPETVKYHLLPAFLLAGYQGQQQTIAKQAGKIEAQAEKIDALEQRLRSLEAMLSQMTIVTARQ